MEVPFQDMIREAGSLLTAEPPGLGVEVVAVLSNGTRRVTIGTVWFHGGITLREQNGELWLVATGSLQPPAPAVPDGPELLLALINSVKQPLLWDRVDESVTATDAQEWCTKYELPVIEALIDKGRPGLSLGLFQREALTLALLCSVWRAIFYKDKPALARDLPQLLKAWANQRRGATDCWRKVVLDHAALIAKSSPIAREALAKMYVEEMLIERLARVNLTFAMGDSVSRLHLTAGLFDICYLQMASLLTKTAVEIRQNLKVCQNCQQLFWGHGNRRYCPRSQCDRRTVHRRKTRGGQKADSTQASKRETPNMLDSGIP